MSLEPNTPLQATAIESVPIARLGPYKGNPRTHSKKQIRQLAESIRKFGFTNPVLISDDDEIIAGHGRVEAAKLMGMTEVPIIRLSHLGPAERRAYVIADNKLALEAGWDRELLAIELQGIIDLEVDVEITGFSIDAIELMVEEARGRSPARKAAPDQQVSEPLQAKVPTITRPGDLWLIGRHQVFCGDARDPYIFQRLFRDEHVELIIAEPGGCDEILRRFKQVTGNDAELVETGASFPEVEDELLKAAAAASRGGSNGQL